MTTAAVDTRYPVTVTFNPPERVPRWLPIFGWLLAIPHYLVLWVLGIVAELCMIVGWFSGVILGRIPDGLLGMITGYLRYQVRVETYLLFMRGAYPAFSFTTESIDPRTDPMVALDVVLAPQRNRLTILFRLLIAIPQFIVLWFVTIATYVVIVIAWFAAIILGRWPSGLQDFALGWMRWGTRVRAYLMLLTDAYPPFSMQ